MIPGKVIGRLVTNQTLAAFSGVKFLIVQPVDERKEPSGKPLVVCDSVGANVGEFVFLVQGREATFPLPDPFNPADMTIIGIIDEVTDEQ